MQSYCKIRDYATKNVIIIVIFAGQNLEDMKIAVFCSANDSIAPAYFKAARSLARGWRRVVTPLYMVVRTVGSCDAWARRCTMAVAR